MDRLASVNQEQTLSLLERDASCKHKPREQ